MLKVCLKRLACLLYRPHEFLFRLRHLGEMKNLECFLRCHGLSHPSNVSVRMGSTGTPALSPDWPAAIDAVSRSAANRECIFMKSGYSIANARGKPSECGGLGDKEIRHVLKGFKGPGRKFPALFAHAVLDEPTLDTGAPCGLKIGFVVADHP